MLNFVHNISEASFLKNEFERTPILSLFSTAEDRYFGHGETKIGLFINSMNCRGEQPCKIEMREMLSG